jgi:hypothetical protein
VEVHVGHPDAQRRVFLEQRLTGIDLLAQPAAYGAADEELDEAPDFVIIKATQGVSYVSPNCDAQYQRAANAQNRL